MNFSFDDMRYVTAWHLAVEAKAKTRKDPSVLYGNDATKIPYKIRINVFQIKIKI
jgi:hypothetical protein